MKRLHLCCLKALRSRKRRRDSCFHYLYGYSPITEVAGCQSERIADQLAEACNDADHRRAGAQHRKIRPGNTAGAFVGHIGEQAHDTQQDHEGERRAHRQAGAGAVNGG